jgi:EAL domain-containing protein (putative c-di-GMP-specific phosphodiesterase class I)
MGSHPKVEAGVSLAPGDRRDVATDSGDRALTEAIIAMVKTLTMTVVAAGVETSLQRTYLQDLACDEMQGCYFTKPIAEGNLPRSCASTWFRPPLAESDELRNVRARYVRVRRVRSRAPAQQRRALVQPATIG